MSWRWFVKPSDSTEVDARPVGIPPTAL